MTKEGYSVLDCLLQLYIKASQSNSSNAMFFACRQVWFKCLEDEQMPYFACTFHWKLMEVMRAGQICSQCLHSLSALSVWRNWRNQRGISCLSAFVNWGVSAQEVIWSVCVLSFMYRTMRTCSTRTHSQRVLGRQFRLTHVWHRPSLETLSRLKMSTG